MSTTDLRLRVLFNLVDGATRPVRNILAGNNQLAASLKSTRGQLKELSKAQKEVASFRELRAGVTATAAELGTAQGRVNALAREMAATTTPTKALKREFDQAKRAAAQLTATHEQQQGQLQQLRTRLSGAGIETRNLAQHERTLRTNIQATTAAMERQERQLAELAAREKKMAAARSKMHASQNAAGRMAGTGAGMLAGGFVATQALKVPVGAYAQAEESAMGLEVAMMRTGAKVPPEFEKINALAMQLGDKLPGATSDFQELMTMLNRQGISSKAILGGMGEATAYLAVQLKKAPDEAAEFAAKLQDATRTSEADMLSLMDVIQRSFYLGVDDNNLLQGFAKLSPAMDTLRIKGLAGAKALAPLLVMADQAGMAGEASGNAFRKIFQLSLDQKKLGKANDLLSPGRRLDFTDGKGEFGGLDHMFKQFDKLKGLNTQTRLGVLKELFGDDAETLQAVALLMDKGVAGYAEVQAKMAAQASMQERVNKQLGTLRNIWDSTTGTFTNGMVAFGAAIAPELKTVAEYLGKVSQKMGAWARENPRTAGAIMKTVAAVAILLAVGGALLLMLASIVGPLALVKFSMAVLGLQGGILAGVLGVAGGALRMVGQAVLFVGRALLMNPIGLAVTGIALAAYAIYRYWEPIKAFFGGLWDQVKAAFAGGLGGIAALIVNWSPLGLFYSAFASVLDWFGVSMPAKFTEFGAAIVAGLVNGILNGLGAVKDVISKMANSTAGWFREKLGIHSPNLGAAALPAGAGSPAGSAPASAPVRKSAPAPLRAQGGAAAAPAAGGSYPITINAAPGMDPAAVARAVTAAMDQRDRAKQSRIGSRLSD